VLNVVDPGVGLGALQELQGIFRLTSHTLHEGTEDANVHIGVEAREVGQRPPRCLLNLPVVLNFDIRLVFNGEDEVRSTSQLVDAHILRRSFHPCLLFEFTTSTLNVCLVELTVAFREGPLLAAATTHEETVAGGVNANSAIHLHVTGLIAVERRRHGTGHRRCGHFVLVPHVALVTRGKVDWHWHVDRERGLFISKGMWVNF
jgi:hypothetical protein